MISYQIESFGRPLAQVLRETPVPSGTEVLLKIERCGVCHSDVHLQDGYFSLGDGQRLDLSRGIAPPRTLGHEIAGRVVAAGPEAEGVAAGDARVVFPWIGCGRCALCRSDQEHLCSAAAGLGIQRDGGFADHVLVPHPRYLLAFDPLPATQACTLACAGITAYGALKKLSPWPAGERLLIIGAGGVGLSAVRLARHVLGTAPIVADVDPATWPLAREAGAEETLDPRAEGAGKQLVRATAGGPAAVIDFVGAAETFAFGLQVVRKGGTLVSVGLFGGATQVSPAMLALRAVTLRGSYVGSLQEMHELMALARQGVLAPLPVRERPLAEANAALDEMRGGRARGRTVLQP